MVLKGGMPTKEEAVMGKVQNSKHMLFRVVTFLYYENTHKRQKTGLKNSNNGKDCDQKMLASVFGRRYCEEQRKLCRGKDNN